MNKSDFDAGKPNSCWLREEVCAEINSFLHGINDRGLISKYNVEVDDETENYIMDVVKSLDDYPEGLKQVAVDIIKEELDENFNY